MFKKALVAVAFSFCVVGVQAQSPRHPGMPAGIDSQTVDVLHPGNQHGSPGRLVPNAPAVAKAAGVTIDTVGDPDSFGHNMVYLGMAQTQAVYLTGDCTGYPPDAGPCIETNPAPASTTVDEPDLAVIQLPGKATRTIICFTFTPFASWQWENATGAQQTAVMYLRPAVRIESEVLNDPSLIDPNTGLPFNGVLMDGTITTFLQARTLNPGEFDFQYRTTTRSCTGGLASVRSLRENYGLSDSVIKDFFKKPITITFGVTGNVSMVTEATYFVGVRLYGD
jgi:hypothetical protein